MSTITTESATARAVKIDPITVELWIAQGVRHGGWNRDAIEYAVERVNRGAVLLDKENPGWMEKVVPDDLTMASPHFCIVGQVYGDYDEHVGIPFGMELLDDFDDREEVGEKAVQHGFIDNGVPFDLLDRVWVYLLTERSHHSKRVILEMP